MLCSVVVGTGSSRETDETAENRIVEAILKYSHSRKSEVNDNLLVVEIGQHNPLLVKEHA